jgi:hypothetical protein
VVGSEQRVSRLNVVGTVDLYQTPENDTL